MDQYQNKDKCGLRYGKLILRILLKGEVERLKQINTKGIKFKIRSNVREDL